MSDRRISAALAALLVMVAIAAVPATAEDGEEQDEWVAKWSNGFKVEKGDRFQLKFGGRLQADYTFAAADDAVEIAFGEDNFQDGFELRRARLFVSGTIYDRVQFKAQYDFAGGDAEAKDLWIGLDTNWGLVMFGHFKEPFSLEELTSAKYIAFLERSLPNAFVAARNSGVGIFGSRGDRWNWGVGYFYDADDFGESMDEDRTNLTGRVAFRPFYEDDGRRMLNLGASVSSASIETNGALRYRARPEAHLTTRLVDTRDFPADGAMIYGVELAGVRDRLWYAAEYVQTDVDAPRVGDPTLDGSYVQVGYFLTDDYRRFKTGSGAFDRLKPSDPWDADGGRGAWELALRFSSIDLTDAGLAGGEQDDLTLALNWYPNPATRLMLNYVHADVDGLGSADFVLVRWQVDF